jgi:hypothetical protein
MNESHEHHCRYLLGALSDFVDETLESALCAEIERHLESCENCQVVVDTLRKTVYLVHECKDTAELPLEVRDRLYERLDIEEFSARAELNGSKTR